MMRTLILLSIGLLTANAANADLGEIPQQSGWSGFLQGGVNAVSYASNLYADDSHPSLINDFSSPESERSLTPLFNADIRYTFADTRTQLFLGNFIQDAVRFDFTQQLGLRQEIGDKGVVATALLFNMTPVEQWSDPFAVDVSRSATDVKSKGVRFAWDKIWGSHVYASMTRRNMTLDEERSGQQYDQQHDTHYASMLDRNGTVHDMMLAYQFHFGQNQLLEPALLYQNARLDGRAERYQNTGMRLTYAKRTHQWTFVSNLYTGNRQYEEANPLFGQPADASEVAINGTFFWHNLFGVQALSASVTAGYAKANSDIDFYDSHASRVSTGLLYHF